MTATYSMISSTHWKLVVQRMPQMQMKVMRASQKPAAMAAMPTELAVERRDPAHSFMNCRVYCAGHDGGRHAEEDAGGHLDPAVEPADVGRTSLDSQA